MKKLLLMTTLFLAFACQTANYSGMQRRDLRQYYVSAGVERFFLPDIPDWMNVSQTAQCERISDIKFINLPKLQNNFKLTYSDAIQFQYYLNRERTSKKEFYQSDYLMLKQEETIFFDISDKIQSGILAFNPPKFKRVNLIWVDPAFTSEKKYNDLLKLMQSSEMDLGHPVFVSMCLDHIALKKFMLKSKTFGENILMIPFDLFSVFSSEQKKLLNFSLEFNALFKDDQEIHLYSPTGKVPTEFLGKFIPHKY